MDNQIVTLVLILGTIIVLAIVVLKHLAPLLEQKEENNHEYQMEKLEKGILEKETKSLGESDLEKTVKKITEDVNALWNSVTNQQVSINNIINSSSFIKFEFESVLERLEKIENSIDILKRFATNSTSNDTDDNSVKESTEEYY